MIALRKLGKGQIESSAHLAKFPEKAVICINDHKGAKAKAEEEFLEVLSNSSG